MLLFAAGIFFITLFCSACEVVPERRLAMMPNPAFFSERSSPFFNANGKPGNVSIERGISSLSQESVEEFKGRNGESLLSLIGRADFIRREGLTQIRQYR